LTTHWTNCELFFANCERDRIKNLKNKGSWLFFYFSVPQVGSDKKDQCNTNKDCWNNQIVNFKRIATKNCACHDCTDKKDNYSNKIKGEYVIVVFFQLLFLLF